MALIQVSEIYWNIVIFYQIIDDTWKYVHPFPCFFCCWPDNCWTSWMRSTNGSFLKWTPKAPNHPKLYIYIILALIRTIETYGFGVPTLQETSVCWSLVDLALEATALLLYDLRKGSGGGGVAAEHEHALTAAVTAICRGAKVVPPQPPVMFVGL